MRRRRPFSTSIPRAAYTACREIATDLRANVLVSIVRRAVGPTRYGLQHGQALGGDLNAVFAKKVGWIQGYLLILFLVLD